MFVVLTIAYHVKLDEPYPWDWRLMHTDDMSDPVIVANPEARRGRLKLELKGNPITFHNARNLLGFVWAWVK